MILPLKNGPVSKLKTDHPLCVLDQPSLNHWFAKSQTDMKHDTHFILAAKPGFKYKSRVVSYHANFEKNALVDPLDSSKACDRAACEAVPAAIPKRKKSKRFGSEPLGQRNVQTWNSVDCRIPGGVQIRSGRSDEVTKLNALNELETQGGGTRNSIEAFDVANDVLVLQYFEKEAHGSRLTIASTARGASISLAGRVVSVASKNGKPIPLHELKKTIRFVKTKFRETIGTSTLFPKRDDEPSQFVERSYISPDRSELKRSAKRNYLDKPSFARAAQDSLTVQNRANEKALFSASLAGSCSELEVNDSLDGMFERAKDDEFFFKQKNGYKKYPERG